ncbi:TPA: hypothetical protein OUG59_003514 [Escherichia coli]|nr:hypothetical protein [Escherichia coli]EIG2128928.1 hypothetical protein [Escherichia coli]EIK3121704.1 hypothetical protein [Escherichia coli]EJV4893631.1 hypothetical protein [Escherichia coli]EKN1673003.1 hypothetical protein [Escherichia coli]MBA8195921.1 hypothetical protein [Escherichia coli]
MIIKTLKMSARRRN